MSLTTLLLISYATTPDECEYMAARAVGWDASPNFETSTSALNENGRTMEGLARMKPWLSLGERLSHAVKKTLTAIDVDYTLDPSAENASAYYIRPGKAHEPAIADPLVTESLTWTVDPAFASKSHIGVRLRALSSVPATENTTDLLLLHKGSGVFRDNQCSGASASPPAQWWRRLNARARGGKQRLTAERAQVAPPNGLMNFSVVTDAPSGGPGTEVLKLNMTNPSVLSVGCFRSRFPKPKDLSHATVIEFQVYGDGSGALLDIELEDAHAFFREFFVSACDSSL